MDKFADIHIHSTLKPFIFFRDNDKNKASVWFQDPPKPRERDNALVRYSEADFTTLIQSGIKIAFVALYAFEQGWTNSWNTGPIADILVHAYTGFPISQINFIQNKNYNYFDALIEEINFLREQIKEPHTVEINGQKKIFFAKIPQNNSELNSFLQEENTLVVIPTIEGANALFQGNAQSVETIKFDQLSLSIDVLKQTMSPFFITLAHHFYNGLCGHAKSIYGESHFQDFIIKIFLNQKYGLCKDLNRKGKNVVEKILAINKFKNEKRILIDVKHMGVEARKSFYKIIKKHNKKHPEDKIPIIASHMGYSGHKDFGSLIKTCPPDSENPFTDSKQKLFNEGRINLCDIDIKNIFDSEGLIGINLDQRIISNKKIVDKADKLFDFHDTDALKKFWAKQISENIIHIAKAVIDSNLQNKQNVWNMFSIGSDFDGFINPVDAYITTKDYNDLKKHLIRAFKENSFLNEHSFGITANELTDKFMYKNARDFLKKHFNKHNKLIS